MSLQNQQQAHPGAGPAFLRMGPSALGSCVFPSTLAAWERPEALSGKGERGKQA